MSLDLGELVGYIKLDHKGVGRGIQAAQADLRAGMGRLEREADAGGQRAGKAAGSGMSGAFKGSIGQVTGLVAGAFAVDKAVQGLGALKTAASDLNETTSMSKVIFGENQAQMDQFARSAPRTLGLAREEALRTSAGFADMFQQLGYGQDAATAASKSVLQYAADLGSFKNLETTDVLDRISAALRGEYDSLQLVIPNINAARVETEALAMSGKSAAAELTAQEKAAATLAIVQKDGSRAMGDFARTADSAANAEKTAAAQARDLAAQVGQQLLPAYIALVTFGRDQVLPFLAATANNLDGVADAAAPVASGVGDVVGVFRSMPEPVQASTLALLGFLLLRPRIEAVGTSLGTKVAGGASSASRALDTVRLNLMYAGDAAKGAETRLGGAAKAVGMTAGAGLRGAATGLLGVLGGPWGLAFTAAVGVAGYFIKQQQDAKRRVEALSETLDKQTAAVTDSTRALAVNRLEEEGVLAAAKSLGLSLETVRDAALGVPFAMAEVERTTKAAFATATYDEFGNALDRNADAAVTIQEKLRLLGGELNTSQESARRKAEAMGEDADATDKATDATEGFTKVTKTAAEAAQEQEDAVRDAAQAILDLTDAQLAASGAQIGYQEALAGVQERLQKRKELEAELRKTSDPEERARIKAELAEYAAGLDLTTQAGRDNQVALNDVAEAAKRQAEASLEAGAGIAEVRAQMATSRDAFIENAVRLGVSREAAEAMATKFGLTKTAVDKLATAIGDVPASKQVKVEVQTAAAKTALQVFKEKLDGLKSKSVVVTVQGRFVNTDTVLPGGGRSTAGGIDAGGGSGPSRGMRYDSRGRIVPEANGGVLKFYADGAHVAQHAPAGAVRVWAEPETGGETYIPHAPSKRGRSTQILAETASMFGYGLVPKGDTRINRTTILHRGNVVANDPREYLAGMEAAARLDALREQ